MPRRWSRRSGRGRRYPQPRAIPDDDAPDGARFWVDFLPLPRRAPGGTHRDAGFDEEVAVALYTGARSLMAGQLRAAVDRHHLTPVELGADLSEDEAASSSCGATH